MSTSGAGISRLRLVIVLMMAILGAALGTAPAQAHHVGDVDCRDFQFQEEVQAHLDAHPGDPDGLDAEGDGIACEALPSNGGTPPQPPPPGTPPPAAFYKAPHAPELYAVDPGARSVRAITFQEWAGAGYPTPLRAPTDFVKYDWSPTIYAVTFWFPEAGAWQWDRLEFSQWSVAGFPVPRTAGYIVDSSYHKWGTSTELFVQGEDGVIHKLSFQQWRDAGFPAFEHRGNEGFVQAPGEATIVQLSSISTGEGRPISYEEWVGQDFPTPATGG